MGTVSLATYTAKKGGQHGPVFCPYFPQRRYSVRENYSITTGTVDARNGNKLHGRARREPSISPFYPSIFPLYTVTARRFLPKGPWIIPYLPSLIRVARCHRIYPAFLVAMNIIISYSTSAIRTRARNHNEY